MSTSILKLVAVVGAFLASVGMGARNRLAEEVHRLAAGLDLDLDLDLASMEQANAGTEKSAKRQGIRVGSDSGQAVLEVVGPSIVQQDATVEITLKLDSCAPQTVWTQSYVLEAVKSRSGELFRNEFPEHVLRTIERANAEQKLGGGERGIFGPNPVDKIQFLDGASFELPPLSIPTNVDILQDIQGARARRGGLNGTGSAPGVTAADFDAKRAGRDLLADYDNALRQAAARSDKKGWDPAPVTAEAQATLLDRCVARVVGRWRSCVSATSGS